MFLLAGDAARGGRERAAAQLPDPQAAIDTILFTVTFERGAKLGDAGATLGLNSSFGSFDLTLARPHTSSAKGRWWLISTPMLTPPKTPSRWKQEP